MPTGAFGKREAIGKANGCCFGNLESASEAKRFVVTFPNTTGLPPARSFANPDPSGPNND